LHNALQAIQGYSPADFGYNTGLSKYQDGTRDPATVELGSDTVASLLEAVNARTLDVTRSEADDICDSLRGSGGSVSLYDVRDWTESTFWERYTAGPASVERLNRSVFSGDAERELQAIRRALAERDDPVDPEDIDTWAITIHASKGMEADDVVVYDGVSQRILSGMQDSRRTERNEYRTWYVACSRPRKRLHIMRHAFPWTNPIIPEQLSEVVR
jgi:DNA helicase-2/ATP-dependent DNA helicase PcrA